jgi:hypothetical protein
VAGRRAQPVEQAADGGLVVAFRNGGGGGAVAIATAAPLAALIL